MAEQRQILIQEILGGHCTSEHYSTPTEFLFSIGIDPDMPKNEGEKKLSGLIRPTASADASGGYATDAPYWIITVPKNEKIYIYCRDGKVIQFDKNLNVDSVLTTLSASSGNGAVYYDNAIYFVRNNDISRYFPLDGTPTFDNNFWTSDCLAIAPLLVQLSNNAYPLINGTLPMPNHPVLYHKGNRAIYICDVVDNSSSIAEDRGKGCVHYIKTKKTTVQGDTIENVNYNALDLEWGYYPTCIENYNGDVVIGAINGVSRDVKQANASLIIWDGLSDSFTINAPLPDPLVTALRVVNGNLIVFTGHAEGGCRVLRYLGGYRFEELAFFEDATPPLQGAVDDILNRIIFGTNVKYTDLSKAENGDIITTTKTKSVIMSEWSRSAKLPMGLHSTIFAPTQSNVNFALITAVKFVEQNPFEDMQPVFGWYENYGSTATGRLNKKSTTFAKGNMIRSELFKIGADFKIDKIEIPFVQKFGINHKLRIKIVVDDGSDVVEFPLFDFNNPSVANKRKLDYTVQNPYSVNGENNFYIQIDFEGTELLTLSLPIKITYTLKNGQ